MDGFDVRQLLLRSWFCLCAMGLTGFVTGCSSELHRRAEAMPIEQDISVHELAKRLSLSVVECNQSLARLGSNGSTVTIFPKPSGSVYVNGKEIATKADITSARETIMLPAELEGEIRHALYWKPVVDSPKIARPKIDVPPMPSPQPVRSIGVVIVDPGHGGKDPGAMNNSGDQEKQVNLAVSLMVAKQLRDNNVIVKMTRDNDVFIDLDERVRICNQTRPDLFVSIHADASRNRQATGFTVYVPKRETNGSRSHRAGQNVAKHMKNTATSRGVQQHNSRLRVLENTNYPAMLIELGFMSNPNEAAQLRRENYRQQLARAIASGILEYLKGH